MSHSLAGRLCGGRWSARGRVSCPTTHPHRWSAYERPTIRFGITALHLCGEAMRWVSVTVLVVDLVSGNFHSLLELVWALILHYTIHTPGKVPLSHVVVILNLFDLVFLV